MLPPDWLINQLDDITVMFSDLHTSVLESIARHVSDSLKTQGRLMPSTVKQIETAAGLGLLRDEIAAHIADTLKLAIPEVRELFEAAAVKSLSYDNEIYREAGLPEIVLRQSPAMNQVLEARIDKFTASLRRLTGTIAINSEDMFERVLNTACNKTIAGTHSYTEALSEGMDEMLREGVTVFSYASGRNISAEAAILMNIRTGISQTAAEITKQGLVEQGCTHVETSAHMGARNTGEGHRSHESWQGKVFRWGELDGEPGFSNGVNNNSDESLTGAPVSDTMSKTTEKVPDVQNVGKIDIEKFKGISPNILTNEVVITDKQLVHITDKRADTYERYSERLPEILSDPDYIFIDPKHVDTALVVKRYDNAAEIVLRLSTETVEKKNSIITMWEIKEPRLQRYILTHKTVYKKE